MALEGGSLDGDLLVEENVLRLFHVLYGCYLHPRYALDWHSGAYCHLALAHGIWNLEARRVGSSTCEMNDRLRLVVRNDSELHEILKEVSEGPANASSNSI